MSIHIVAILTAKNDKVNHLHEELKVSGDTKQSDLTIQVIKN